MTLKKTMIIVTLVCILALATGGAMATGPAAQPVPMQQQQQQHQTQQATSNGYGGAGGTAIAPSGDTSLYVLPAPIGGSNLPAGMCQRSKYSHVAGGWNFISVANGDSHTDLECLRLLIELERLRATPMPKPVVEILTTPPPSYALAPPVKTGQEQCTPPARAKTVAAAKKAGACR